MLELIDRSADMLERLPPPYQLLARFSPYVDVEALLTLPYAALCSSYHVYHDVDGVDRSKTFMTLRWSEFPRVGHDVTIPVALFRDNLDYWLREAHPIIYRNDDQDGLFYHRGRRITYDEYRRELSIAMRSAQEALSAR